MAEKRPIIVSTVEDDPIIAGKLKTNRVKEEIVVTPFSTTQ